jgi:iron complex transport system substrate-binding protein
MKSYFFTFITLFLLTSCKKETYKLDADFCGSKNVYYTENGNNLILKSGKFQYKISENKLPFRRVMLLNASLIGYFTELNVENVIIGVSSPQYIYSEKILQNIKAQKIQNIGNEQKYNIEKILAYQPDAIFTNYVASFDNTYEILRKNKIEVIFIDEYQEENPLEKTKIIEVFGKLLGKEKEARQKFAVIERNYNFYKNLALTSKEKPQVLANEIYGNQWFVAGGNSTLAHFIKDAKANYIFGDNKESKSTPKTFEEVFAKAENADVWVNVGNHKYKKELLQINPNYAKMNIYKKGNIYTLSGREKGNANDYFESGVVRADLVLKDYVKIFHSHLFPKDSLFYIKKLK